MGIREWVWDTNWGNAILWTLGFIVVKDWLFPSRLFGYYEMFGFWVATIGEFLFVFLSVILVRPYGVKRKYVIIHNKCKKQFTSLTEYDNHIKICKGKIK